MSPSRKDESDAEVTVSEEHIAYALRQVEQGTPAAELCRKLGISEQTFYTRAAGWKGSSMAWPSCAALDRDCAIEPAGFCVTAGTCCCSTPNTNLVPSTYLRRSAALLIHAMTAARNAAWSGMPSALARVSRCLQTLAGRRTERGTVGPVSVPFLGLPRPTWMEIPSAAIRRAYGLRRTLAWSKFTSGISRNDARDGHRSQSLRPTTLRNPYRADNRTSPILSKRYLRFPRILVRPWSGHRWPYSDRLASHGQTGGCKARRVRGHGVRPLRAPRIAPHARSERDPSLARRS